MISTITPDGGGKIEVRDGSHAITLDVAGPLSPGSIGVTLTRAEAEAVTKALSTALARLRTVQARPERVEPLDAALKGRH